MGDVASGDDRRRAMRVPVQGVAVCYGDTGPLRGTIENLSSSGVLVDLRPRREPVGAPIGDSLELELKLGISTGRMTARAVRIERHARRLRVALCFDALDTGMRAAIDAAIDHAVIAAERRPVLVVDDNVHRRAALLEALESQGMSPVAARTPLDAIAILTNPHLAVSVALLAPSFGHSLEALRHVVSDSFPWVHDAEIDDDIFGTLERTHAAWGATDSARFARAIA